MKTTLVKKKKISIQTNSQYHAVWWNARDISVKTIKHRLTNTTIFFVVVVAQLWTMQ